MDSIFKERPPVPARIAIPGQADRRRNRRFRIQQRIRVRPSEFLEQNLEEVRTTSNVSRDGLYFETSRNCYAPGMQLIVTCPFSSVESPIQFDYLAEVTRVEDLPDGGHGVAVHLVHPIQHIS